MLRSAKSYRRSFDTSNHRFDFRFLFVEEKVDVATLAIVKPQYPAILVRATAVVDKFCRRSLRHQIESNAHRVNRAVRRIWQGIVEEEDLLGHDFAVIHLDGRTSHELFLALFGVPSVSIYHAFAAGR